MGQQMTLAKMRSELRLVDQMIDDELQEASHALKKLRKRRKKIVKLTRLCEEAVREHARACQGVQVLGNIRAAKVLEMQRVEAGNA